MSYKLVCENGEYLNNTCFAQIQQLAIPVVSLLVMPFKQKFCWNSSMYCHSAQEHLLHWLKLCSQNYVGGSSVHMILIACLQIYKVAQYHINLDLTGNVICLLIALKNHLFLHFFYFLKWPMSAIFDIWKSLLFVWLTISDHRWTFFY